jgi:hypothetical protein
MQSTLTLTVLLGINREYFDKVVTVVSPLLKKHFILIVNADKSENALVAQVVGHSDMAAADRDAWHNTRKLVFLLGVEKRKMRLDVFNFPMFRSISLTS